MCDRVLILGATDCQAGESSSSLTPCTHRRILEELHERRNGASVRDEILCYGPTCRHTP